MHRMDDAPTYSSSLRCERSDRLPKARIGTLESVVPKILHHPSFPIDKTSICGSIQNPDLQDAGVRNLTMIWSLLINRCEFRFAFQDSIRRQSL